MAVLPETSTQHKRAQTQPVQPCCLCPALAIAQPQGRIQNTSSNMRNLACAAHARGNLNCWTAEKD
eukprot:11013881-Alexandrium_andersonii.AAC.1